MTLSTLGTGLVIFGFAALLKLFELEAEEKKAKFESDY